MSFSKNEVADLIIQYVRSNIGDKEFGLSDIKDKNIKKYFTKFICHKDNKPNIIDNNFDKIRYCKSPPRKKYKLKG